MKTFVLVPGVLLTFLCLAAGSSDSSCPESCDVSKCEQTSVTCTGGKHVKDDCSCCDVCLRFDNEICGGLHGRFGKCSEGLKCIDVNNEAFMNDDTETEMEDDVVGVCQALTSTETTKIFYISFRLNNTYGKNIVLLTSLTSPHARINISNMETFTLLTGVPNKEPISLQAFVKTSEEKIPINGQDVFFIVPGERQQEPTVLNIPRKLGVQDCILSRWSSWSKCSEQCGFGTMKRRRTVLQAPKNGGKPCPIKHEKKGCFQQNCEGDMVLAQILPAEYRRQPFGSSEFDSILPQKELTEIEKARRSFRSHCVNFKLMSKHPYCEGTWAEKLKLSKPMCVECQPAIMDNEGFCKGEGIVGNFTSWVATDVKSCSGLWMRVGEKIPNCRCVDQKFQNFIFV